MGLDGLTLRLVKAELEPALTGCRVDKVFEPSREELILAVHKQGFAGRLLLCAKGSSPRVQFTQMAYENPKEPPMFCMLLRKCLVGARVTALRQEGLDRVLYLDLEGADELGQEAHYTLVAEMTGRYANIILTRDGRIVDALKRVATNKPGTRELLPGLEYLPPRPPAGQLDLTAATGEVLVAGLLAAAPEKPLTAAVSACFEGVGPLLAREIAHFAQTDADTRVADLDDTARRRLAFYLEGLGRLVREDAAAPTALLREDGVPKDFSFLRIEQYGELLGQRRYDSFSELFDAYYGEKDAAERIRRRGLDLSRLVNGRIERVHRRLEAQRQELAQSADRQRLRIYGDLLAAHIHSFDRPDTQVTVPNLYEADAPAVTIPLNPLLSPAKNVQRYYAEYRKADTAERVLTGLVQAGEQELVYLESVADALERCTREEELTALRAELVESGYARRPSGLRGKKENPDRLPFLRFRSSDGFLMLCGRNNLQNERLSLRQAKGGDLWLHVKDRPGSHLLIVTEGAPVPDSTLVQAASLAALHSSARESTKVPVDYTLAKYVKKIPGSKPGMVRYTNFQTLLADPDAELAQRLREKG